jgi:hypothetical protein
MNLLKMKLFRLSSYLIIVVLIFYSCDTVLEDDLVNEGKYTFWSNFDGPPIDIFVDNIHYGTIDLFYPDNPGCEAEGCVTVTLPAGDYEFKAIEQFNSSGTPSEWNGTISIKANTCSTLGLSL